MKLLLDAIRGIKLFMRYANIVHIVIAPASNNSGLLFRRNHLAKYLKKRKETTNVIWLYPQKVKLNNPMHLLNITRKNHHILLKKNNLNELAFPVVFFNKYLKYSRLKNVYSIPLKRALSQKSTLKVLWYTYPAFPWLIDLIPWDCIVYDCSDLWTAISSGTVSLSFSDKFQNKLKRKAEDDIIRNSDLILTTSDYLAEHITKRSSKNPVVIENGVNFEMFRNTGRVDDGKDVLKDIPHPRLGFVGGLKPKINYSLLSELADEHPEWSIVLIGPRQRSTSKRTEYQDLVRKKNVYWVGECPPQEAPVYMQALDLGLLPYKEIEYNKAVFPLKLFEYLAAGIPVVGCGLPSTIKYVQKHIYLHEHSGNFEKACLDALSWNNNDTALVEKRIGIAEKADWHNKFNSIYERLHRILDARSQ